MAATSTSPCSLGDSMPAPACLRSTERVLQTSYAQVRSLWARQLSQGTVRSSNRLQGCYEHDSRLAGIVHQQVIQRITAREGRNGTHHPGYHLHHRMIAVRRDWQKRARF